MNNGQLQNGEETQEERGEKGTAPQECRNLSTGEFHTQA